ncbi:MAG: peptidyl-tRNA hydrolase Pth2 [DPANN group archaeon]|nr:peptidyl-tRNA hydrolase Pth2 [DPANN group archaeon]
MTLKQVIVVRADIGMSKGKTAAQAAHASVSAVFKTQQHDKIFQATLVKDWTKQGAKKIVLQVKSEKDLIKLADLCVRAGLKHAIIKDAGETELPPGTMTALGIGPDDETKIDKITGSLSAL